jgi:hypothetical protein
MTVESAKASTMTEKRPAVLAGRFIWEISDMQRKFIMLLLCLVVTGAYAPLSAASSLNIYRYEALERVFKDDFQEPQQKDTVISVPRGGTVSHLFGLWSENDSGTVPLNLKPIQGFKGTIKTYELSMVPVEANNNGGSKTQVGVRPPENWMKELLREAPFQVAEVLKETSSLTITKETNRFAVLVEVSIPTDCAPGVYKGQLWSEDGHTGASASFSFRVHDTVLPERYALEVTNWFWPQPENVSYGNTPDWWSEEHWRLIKNSARVMRDYGQRQILTPTLNGRQALIQTIRQKDGSYTFDFRRFDRWAALFLGLGYDTLEGQHVGGGHSIAMPPMRSWGGVWVRDEATGKTEKLFAKAKSADPWIAFLPTFYQALHAHLMEKGWLGHYVQCQLDEPRDPAEYKRLADTARAHLPGIKTKDAINSQPRKFSPLVDIHVFNLITLNSCADLAEARRAQGQSNWLYHCCSPYPPYPNRHLDERLTNSRLYPWLAYMLKADGYLYWGANIYRGADPYKTSIGPVPNGSQSPGHPPGDNWLFYPTKDGLVPSMRMVAFRDGLIDHTLLTMLAQKDKAKTDALMQQIARSITDYAKTPDAYHAARRALLEALDEK